MPIGANMAVRASVIARVGGLRTDLGKLAGLAPDRRGPRVLPAAAERRVSRRVRTGRARWPSRARGASAARLFPALALPERARRGAARARLSGAVPFLLGVPRYLWRQLIADGVATLRARSAATTRSDLRLRCGCSGSPATCASRGSAKRRPDRSRSRRRWNDASLSVVIAHTTGRRSSMSAWSTWAVSAFCRRRGHRRGRRLQRRHRRPRQTPPDWLRRAAAPASRIDAGKIARHCAGGRRGRRSILVFTDDDVNVEEGWLDAVRDGMADPAVALVGGPVQPRWQATVPRWIRRARDRHPRLGAPIALLDYGDRPVELGVRTLLGANLAVRREVFARVGGFPATSASCAGHCSRAKITSSVAACRTPVFARCTCLTQGFVTGSPLTAREPGFSAVVLLVRHHARRHGPRRIGHEPARSSRLPLYLVARAARASAGR